MHAGKKSLIVAALLAALATHAVHAQSDACAAVKQLPLAEGRIENAVSVPSGPLPQDNSPYHPAYPKDWILPAYCEVSGVLHQRTGADGAAYGDHFLLRLPSPWNGKFLFQGGGGTDGVAQPPLGIVSNHAQPALMRGYAIITADSGHAGQGNTAFGREQQARLDYAFNSIGEVTRAARQIVAAYYAKPASHAYFMGCSNGGREAMMAAQRYPLDFDGIIAGDPGFRLSHAAIAEAWDTEAFNSAAPRDEQNRPILSKSFSNEDLTLLVKAVLEKCDALDGLADGEINNLAACHFDPAALTCIGEKTPQCLSRAQVDALHRSFGGAHDSKGQPLYSSWPYDAGLADFGWRIWKLGMSPNATPNAINTTMGANTLRDYFVHPFQENFDSAHVDFDRVAAQVAETSAINDADSTEISTFTARGGKLLIYEGTSDPVFSADDVIAYYRALVAANGGAQKALASARLFLIPGMTHCGGGPSTDEFDSLTALEQWVEAGHAPERIVASGKAFPHRTRPLCPYPQYAAYNGSGDPEDATHFTCKE